MTICFNAYFELDAKQYCDVSGPAEGLGFLDSGNFPPNRVQASS